MSTKDTGGYIRDAKELAIMQSYPLDMKIMLTKQRIREWVYQFGEDSVVVSFSGGKDSTVLLHLVREEFPDVKAVFSNTGLEYPEIQRFVKSFDNVDIVTPKMHFNEVISTYGYPLISKEVAEAIYYARRIRSQDVNVERERTEQASSSTREQSYTERERQDTQSQKVPHGEMTALHTHTHTAAMLETDRRRDNLCGKLHGRDWKSGGRNRTLSRQAQREADGQSCRDDGSAEPG